MIAEQMGFLCTIYVWGGLGSLGLDAPPLSPVSEYGAGPGHFPHEWGKPNGD